MADDRRHNVEGSADGADSAEQDAQRPVVGAVAGRENLRGQRSIGKPANIRRGAGAVEAVATEKTEVQQQAAKCRYPEAEGVQPRKRHVARAQHQRYQIIPEAEENRHADEENHGRAVHREQAIEDLRRDQAVLWNRELNAHHDGFQARDYKKDQCVPDVHQADLLVVHRGDPGVQHLQHQRTRFRRRCQIDRAG